MDDATKCKIDSLVEEIHKLRLGHSPDSLQAPFMAELHGIIAKEQAKSADKMEQQTAMLIRLTWVIAALTMALLFFTIVLYKDAHAQIERDKLTEHGKSQ